MHHVHKILLVGAAALLLPAVSSAQDVIREMPANRLEGILKSMNIDFTKGDHKGTPYYDYSVKNTTVRLWNFNGKDLMIDVVMNKVDWEVINSWNGTAKFSRARLADNNTVLESNFDLTGGVTEEAVKHFIRSFDNELTAWAKRAPGQITEEEIFKTAAAEQLEKVLGNLKIKYDKKAGKGNNVFYYDFERNNHRIRLTNFGGADLMIDSTFADAALEKVNQWNSMRSYVRAVRYAGNGRSYTALEANLDCMAGVSEEMIRYFITTFDDETVAFDNHLKGKK